MTNLVDILILDNSHHVLKMLLNRQIEIYNIKSSSLGNIYRIKASDMNKIPFEIRIVNYKGIKKYLYAILKHKFFLIGLLIAVIEMFVISNVIIKIDVLHNDKKIRELVYEALEENGIHELTFKKSFNKIQEIKKSIKNNNKDKLEWIEIIDDGMKYTVRVEEREKININKEKKYCDIISTKDAVITNNLVYKGQSMIDINSYVKKGSTLISGEIYFNEEIKAYTCAQALVYGNTWYTLNIKIPFKEVIREYTGKIKTNYMIKIMEKGRPIFKSHFTLFDSKKSVILEIGPIKLYRIKEKEL